MCNRPAIVRSPKKAAHPLLERKLVATERVLKKYWKKASDPHPSVSSGEGEVGFKISQVHLHTTLDNMQLVPSKCWSSSSG